MGRLYVFRKFFLQIKCENRFHGYHGRSCLVMVDGTDFWICEPKPFAKDFYSHKFAKAGLRYEVGVCIQNGLIVWINGPFVLGKYNDITNFQSKMIYELLDREMVKADQGYVGQPNKICVKYEIGVSENQFKAKTKAMARGETINRKLNIFCVLTNRYIDKISMHSYVFGAVAVLMQSSLTSVSLIFKVDYLVHSNLYSLWSIKLATLHSTSIFLEQISKPKKNHTGPFCR